MDLHLVVLPFVLAFSLASTNQCVSSPGSSIELSLHSLKNASGHWIITVDTRQFTMKENPRELTVNVHQETSLCDSNEIDQLISVAFVYPSLHDTSVAGITKSAVPSSATPTRTTAAPSTTATNITPTTTTTSNPKSCPQPGYRIFPGFNCYKAFSSRGEQKTWIDAREQCRTDGGDLMVMETEREREDVYIPLQKSVKWSNNHPWVGVYIPQGGDGWMTVKGEPALSAWWERSYPTKDADRKCARALLNGELYNWDCAEQRTFICEIPL